MLRHVYICCNTKRNIMKNQVGHPDLGSRGESLCIVGRPNLGSRGESLCIFVLCFLLSPLFIFCYKIYV